MINEKEPNKREAEQLFREKQALFKKQKKLIREHLTTVPFKEPILILMRRTRQAEFYENAKGDTFEYEHSNGDIRNIHLSAKYLQSFNYGEKIFQGYICHEDFPTPLPEEPIITADTMGIAIDKVLNDVRLWRVEELKGKTKMIGAIAGLIAVIIGGYILFRMLIQPNMAPTQAEVQAINETIKNVTQTILPTTIIT